MTPSRRTPELPKSWHALPYTDDMGRVSLVKAPTYSDFLDQQHYGPLFRLPRAATAELPIANSLIDGEVDLKAMKPGQSFLLERYPQGLSVMMPSGWKLVCPFDVASGVRIEGATKAQPKGNPKRRGKAKAPEEA